MTWQLITKLTDLQHSNCIQHLSEKVRSWACWCGNYLQYRGYRASSPRRPWLGKRVFVLKSSDLTMSVWQIVTIVWVLCIVNLVNCNGQKIVMIVHWPFVWRSSDLDMWMSQFVTIIWVVYIAISWPDTGKIVHWSYFDYYEKARNWAYWCRLCAE